MDDKKKGGGGGGIIYTPQYITLYMGLNPETAHYFVGYTTKSKENGSLEFLQVQLLLLLLLFVF